MPKSLVGVLVLGVALAANGCVREETAPAPAPSTTAPAITSTTGDGGGTAEGCAHVVDGEIGETGAGVHRISATVRSADTGWEKYADAWEVRTPDGEVIGTRELAHPHVDEQPFTRSLSGVEIPDDVTEVVLAARDSVEGFCGETLSLPVP